MTTLHRTCIATEITQLWRTAARDPEYWRGKQITMSARFAVRPANVDRIIAYHACARLIGSLRSVKSELKDIEIPQAPAFRDLPVTLVK